MAAGVSLHGGRWGYGAGTALFIWATEEAWPWFDGWCCVKGIDPWELPAPRLMNVIWYAFTDGKEFDEAEAIREDLLENNEVPHPLQQLRIAYRYYLQPPAPKPSRKADPARVEVTDATTLARKTDYVPPWWTGERAAYQNAKSAMAGISNLPKMKT